MKLQCFFFVFFTLTRLIGVQILAGTDDQHLCKLHVVSPTNWPKTGSTFRGYKHDNDNPQLLNAVRNLVTADIYQAFTLMELNNVIIGAIALQTATVRSHNLAVHSRNKAA